MSSSKILSKLLEERKLTLSEWHKLLESQPELFSEVRRLAQNLAKENFGTIIYYRGIVEFTNICQNDCLYCGLRRSNTKLLRYRLTKEEIMACCQAGYELGVKTFVLQGGEDPSLTDAWLVDLIKDLKATYPSVCITLSLGEREASSLKKLYAAGARRYLLRHETASPKHYAKLHAPYQSFWKRIQCLYDLKAQGYQTGCGMMIGSPFQTLEDLALDFSFIQEFKPEMLGIGPFLPHHATPFKDYPRGSGDLTLYVLALSRLLLPKVLMPATTALQTLLPNGYQEGLLSGCNVIMPNLTLAYVRHNYQIYDHKPNSELSKALDFINQELKELGYTLKSTQGNYSADQDGK